MTDTDMTTDDKTTDKDTARGHEPESPNAEAAKYRRRLRETEAAHLEAEQTWQTERAQLIAQRDGLRKAEVDRIAEDHGVKPALVWAAGTELGDLVADDGTVDKDKVSAAVDSIAKEFLPPPRLAPSLNGAGRMGEPIGPGPDDEPSWNSIIKGHGDRKMV